MLPDLQAQLGGEGAEVRECGGGGGNGGAAVAVAATTAAVDADGCVALVVGECEGFVAAVGGGFYPAGSCCFGHCCADGILVSSLTRDHMKSEGIVFFFF